MPNTSASGRISRHSWFTPAVVALVAFIGGVASNLVAVDLESLLPLYRPVVWGIFTLALITTIAAAVRESKHPESSRATTVAASRAERSVSVGRDTSGTTIVTGDQNVIHIGRNSESGKNGS